MKVGVATRIPYLLILFRFFLGPLLFLDAWDGKTGAWFLVALLAGFASDLFDGVIARRTHSVTVRLRELDGRTDVWFIAWVLASIWRTYPGVLTAYRFPLLIVAGFQVAAWVLDWLKYRRFSNYHTYTAKAWGATILIALVSLFGFGEDRFLLCPAILAGILCTLEEMLITLLLPRWVHDVPSVFHALELRREMYTREAAE